MPAPSVLALASSRPPRWRLGLVLWLLGLPGVVSLGLTVVPEWTAQLHWPMSQAFAHLVFMLGLAAVLALAVWAGLSLGLQVRLGAPLLLAWLQGRSPWRALRYLALPVAAGSVAGAAWLVTLAVTWPESLSVIDPVYGMPLLAKLLYGGITEELLLRFGGLSLVMWGLWNLWGEAGEPPGWPMGCWAVVISAVLFGLAPMGIAWAVAGTLPHLVSLQLLLCEIVYGVMAGFLFWRYGLEAAVLAHLIAYVLSHGLV